MPETYELIQESQELRRQLREAIRKLTQERVVMREQLRVKAELLASLARVRRPENQRMSSTHIAT